MGATVGAVVAADGATVFSVLLRSVDACETPVPARTRHSAVNPADIVRVMRMIIAFFHVWNIEQRILLVGSDVCNTLATYYHTGQYKQSLSRILLLFNKLIIFHFCVEHGIGAEIEVISADEIDTAWERVLASDVRYRFVIDAATI